MELCTVQVTLHSGELTHSTTFDPTSPFYMMILSNNTEDRDVEIFSGLNTKEKIIFGVYKF